MTVQTTYFVGGFASSHPSQNKAAEWDTTLGTFTRWDESGSVVEQRPLTADETAGLAPPADPQATFRDALTAGRVKATNAEKIDALYAALLGETTNVEPQVRPR